MLIGVLAALCVAGALIAQARTAPHGPSEMLLAPALETTRSVRQLLNILSYAVLDGLRFAIGCLFLLTLVRRLTGVTWIAGAALVLVVATLSPAAGGPVAPLIGLVSVFLLLRVGLLAFAVAQIGERMLTRVPLALDLGHWYAGSTMVVMLVIAAAALFGGAVAARHIPRHQPQTAP